MKDPTSTLFQGFTNIISSGNMSGQYRPVGRVAISKNIINAFPTPRGTWRSYRKRVDLPLLDTKANWPEQELPNVLSITIDRELGQASASCEITVGNTDMTLPEVNDFGLGNPGYLTADRGVTPKDYTVEFSTRMNEWFDVIRPNRIIHTYQGYGTSDTTNFDPRNPNYVSPAHDTMLQQTGVWIIDSVTMNAPQATMTIVCRDAAKLLVEQFSFPPVIDEGRWPLQYSPAVDAPSGNTGVQSITSEIQVLNVAKWQSSSNNIVNPTTDTPQFGHYPSQSTDSSEGTAWLSDGHSSSRGSDAFEWIEFSTGGNNLNYLRVITWRGGYIMYVSFDVTGNGSFVGSVTIPYVSSGTNNNSAQPYSISATVQKENVTEIIFPTDIQAKAVRLTFTGLSDYSDLDSNTSTQYRVGIRDVVLGYRNRVAVDTTPVQVNVGQPGVIRDYSEIVREILAWGGFFEPASGTIDPVVAYLDASGVTRGGLWADVEILNSAPITQLPVDEFTSVALMDVVQKVADIHGAVFFIDDDGAAIFRLPNIWQIGSYIVDPLSTDPRVRISTHPIVIDESVNLISLTTIIDDASLRSDFLVTGNGGGSDSMIPTGGFTPGFNAANPSESAEVDDKDLLAGQIRVAAISNAPVTSDLEAQRMAELLGLEAHFTYRRSTIKALCHPGLQLDDQIKVRERITNDSYVHYVVGITTNMDLDTGEYTMTLQTHWLGDDPTHTWTFNTQSQNEIVQYYTDALAKWKAITDKLAGK